MTTAHSLAAKEQELLSWERSLVSKQQQFDENVNRFREEIRVSVDKLCEREARLSRSERELHSRLERIQSQESSVEDMMQELLQLLDRLAHRDAAAHANSEASPSSRPSSPKYSEGKAADQVCESFVEELSSSASSKQSKEPPRGLRASPRFEPLNPDDDPESIRLLRRQSSLVTLRPEDSEFQCDFDEAVEFLIENEVLTVERLQDMISQGIHPKDIIKQFQELYCELRAQAAPHSFDDDDENVDEMYGYEEGSSFESDSELPTYVGDSANPKDFDDP